MANVFIACPLYDGRLHAGTAKSLWATASRNHRHRVYAQGASLLTFNCNWLWATALNERGPREFTWFAMLHSDVEPEEWWLDKMIDIAEKHAADALAAVVPMKENSGATSTAISQPGNPYQCFTRLMMAQVNQSAFPDVFDIHAAASALEQLAAADDLRTVPREALLVNTGCFICRLDRPWCERVHFSLDDTVRHQGGEWKAGYQSEDWLFSRRIAEQGGKVMATKLVRVKHWGTVFFDSSQVWGNPRDAAH